MSVIIIPAYNPTEKLIELVENIKHNNFNNIIVVNDGSTNNAENIFGKIDNYVTLLVHEKNLGKGSAIKTALNYIKQNNIQDKILIMDADGQHDIEDGIKLLNQINNSEKKLILGMRNTKKMPFKSKIGNTITKNLFNLLFKSKIDDTQTGLRAFNYNLVEGFLNIKGDRYEYETNMLIYCIKNNIQIEEIEIKTIYFDKNKCSNFRLFLDSFKIYCSLFSFKNIFIKNKK